MKHARSIYLGFASTRRMVASRDTKSIGLALNSSHPLAIGPSLADATKRRLRAPRPLAAAVRTRPARPGGLASGGDLEGLVHAGLDRLARVGRHLLGERGELLALRDEGVELLAGVGAGELDRFR